MKITPADWYQRFHDLGCQLINSESTLKRLGNNPKFTIRGKCDHVMRVDYYKIKKSKDRRCENCKKINQKHDTQRNTYNTIVQNFSNHGCQVVTTFRDYILLGMNCHSRISYIAQCGHLRTSNFYNQKSNDIWKCKSCASKNNLKIV